MTHQATDDIALVRTIPNMTILECGDATEVESVIALAHEIPGPVYVRILRGEVPRLFPETEPMQLGKARVLSTGKDITIISSGICTEEAMRVTSLLRQLGVGIQHLHISTHKPFNDPVVLDALAKNQKGVITMENHTIVGGLGTSVAEMIAENGLGNKLVRLGLQDVYAHGASKPYLMKKYGFDAMGLVGAVEHLINEHFEISEADLKSVHITPVHSESKVEAL